MATGSEGNEFLIAEYITQGHRRTIERKISSLVRECGVGSWLPLPFEESASAQGPLGIIVGHTAKLHSSQQLYRFQLHFPCSVLGSSIGELLEFTMGAVSALRCLKLLKLDIPKCHCDLLSGNRPRRDPHLDSLINRQSRPLIQAIIKPCFGLSDDQTLDLVSQICLGGVDLIKDDELAAHGSIAAQLRRVTLIKETIVRSCRSAPHRPLYFVQLSGPVGDLLQRAYSLQHAGADGFLFSPYSYGYDLQNYVSHNLPLPIESHPSSSGIWYSGKVAKLSARLVVGLLPRLAGASIVMIFAPDGKFRMGWGRTHSIFEHLSDPRICWTTYPAFAGGLHPAHVDRLVSEFGFHIIVAAGAAIVGHPMGPQAGAIALREAAEESVLPASKRSKPSPELRVALDAWNKHELIYDVRL